MKKILCSFLLCSGPICCEDTENSSNTNEFFQYDELLDNLAEIPTVGVEIHNVSLSKDCTVILREIGMNSIVDISILV